MEKPSRAYPRRELLGADKRHESRHIFLDKLLRSLNLFNFLFILSMHFLLAFFLFIGFIYHAFILQIYLVSRECKALLVIYILKGARAN